MVDLEKVGEILNLGIETETLEFKKSNGCNKGSTVEFVLPQIIPRDRVMK